VSSIRLGERPFSLSLSLSLSLSFVLEHDRCRSSVTKTQMKTAFRQASEDGLLTGIPSRREQPNRRLQTPTASDTLVSEQETDEDGPLAGEFNGVLSRREQPNQV
jgi:hypothetical protein